MDTLIMETGIVVRGLVSVIEEVINDKAYISINNIVDSYTADIARKNIEESMKTKYRDGGDSELKITNDLSKILKYLENNKFVVTKSNYGALLYFILNSSNDCFSVTSKTKKITKEEYSKSVYELIRRFDNEGADKYKCEAAFIFLKNRITSLQKINSLSDYIKKITTKREKITGAYLLYRGHSDMMYDLKPSLFRNDNYMSNEEILIGKALISNDPLIRKCQNDFQKLALFQHHGLPTRLLDVTENPLVALYFACLDKKRIGEVILFEVNYKEGIIYEEDDLVRFDKLKNKKHINIKKDYAFVRGVYTNERIKNQRGLFVLYKEMVNIEERLKEIWYVERNQKEAILKELALYGIDERFVYPELEYVCKNIKKEFN